MFHDFIMTDLNEDSKQVQSSHISNLPLVEFKSTIFGIQMPNFWTPIYGVLKKKSSIFADVLFSYLPFFFVFAGFCLQMVIERSNLREEEKSSGGVEEEQMYYIQIAQLVIVVALILAVWVSKVTSVSDYDLVLVSVSFLGFDFGFSKSNTVPTFIFRLSVLLCIHSGVSRVRRQVFRKQKQKNLQKLKLTNDMLPAI